MSANKELADRLRVAANFLESLPEFELESLSDLTIFTKTAAEIVEVSKFADLDYHQNYYRSTRYVAARADENVAGIDIRFMHTDELKPEEYPQGYKVLKTSDNSEQQA